MFDLQRNLLTALLIAGTGVLGVVFVAQTVFMGRPNVEAIAPADPGAAEQMAVDTPDTGLSELQYYSVITEYPLFFADRRLPPLDMDSLGEEEEEIVEIEEPEEPIEGLRARVAGIIVTSDSRMAMIYDEVADRTVHLREGMSLEGEQADWRLERIDTRLAHFVATDGKEAELELEVYTSALEGERASRDRGDRTAEADRRRDDAGREEAQEDQREAARARAEEVRSRVAERRAELREEARRRQEAREGGSDDRDSRERED